MYKAKDWAEGFLYIILNVPECLSILKDNMNLATKEHLIELFNLIEKKSPHHYDLIKVLRADLEKK
jgi:hypothetical protein